MKDLFRANAKQSPPQNVATRKGLFRIPIAIRLILSFLLIIVLTSLIFTIVGIQIIGDRIVAEA